jgi:hypothetical protein
MSSTVLLVALAHAVGVFLVAAVSRSRGWTLLAAIAALLLALGWGHPQDVAEKWVAIGLGYWACWRMLPRRKFPRPGRPGRSARANAHGATVAGLASVVLMVAMLAIVTAVPGRFETRRARVPAMAMQTFSANSPATVTQKTSKGPVRSTW